MENFNLYYNGNQLTGVTEATADYDFAGSFEYKRARGSQYIYTLLDTHFIDILWLHT